MMDLSTFLATANADDNLALTEAQAYTETTGALIHRDSMNSFLAQGGIYAAMKKIAAEDGHAWQDAVSAFMDSQEFNFMQGTTTGDAQIAMLDGMIAGGITQGVGARSVDVSGALAAIKPTVLARANKATNPFANATIEQVKAIRHPATWKPVTIASGNPQVVLPEGTALAHSGSFRFTVTPAESFNGKVQIRIKSKQENQTTFALWPQYPIVITINSADAVKYVFKRVKELQAERHFSFEYLELYDGALTSVSVEGIA